MNVKNDYYINCGSWKDDDDGIFLPERNIGKGIAPWPLMYVSVCARHASNGIIYSAYFLSVAKEIISNKNSQGLD